MKKTVFFLVFGIAFCSTIASANLVSVGPINPKNGFPQYYGDANGIQAELTSPPFRLALSATTQGAPILPPTMIFDPVDILNPFSVKIGFGTEAYYFRAVAVADARGRKFADSFGNRIDITMALVATFAPNAAASPNVTDGQQMVTNRLSVQYPNANAPGIYTLQYPFGIQQIVVTEADIAFGKGLSYNIDIGLLAQNFADALGGPITGFLQQFIPPPVITRGTLPPFDTGWLGDGVTPATVIGSPTGFNGITLTGPPGSNLGGLGNDMVSTGFFITSGHIFPASATAAVSSKPTPISAVATVSNIAGQPVVNIATSSTNSAVIVCRYDGQDILMRGDGRGNATQQMLVADNGSVPDTITVLAQSANGTQSEVAVPVKDIVKITKATYSLKSQLLTVQAVSNMSNFNIDVLLTADGINDSFSQGILQTPMSFPPATVTVRSSLGGSLTQTVKIIE